MTTREADIARIAAVLEHLPPAPYGGYGYRALSGQNLAAALYDAGLRAEPAEVAGLREALEPPATGLDAAWAKAEAALPEGWFIGLLVWAFPSAVASPEVAWTASAADYSDDDGPAASGTGPTPTAALQALAAKLREKP